MVENVCRRRLLNVPTTPLPPFTSHLLPFLGGPIAEAAFIVWTCPFANSSILSRNLGARLVGSDRSPSPSSPLLSDVSEAFRRIERLANFWHTTASSPPNAGLDDLCFRCLRRKRHEGTRARATSQPSTLRQLANKPRPPSHTTDFKISACELTENRSILIKAAESNCSSAGSRLVVVRK